MIVFRPPAGSLLGAARLDRAAFAPSDTQPAMLQVVVGPRRGRRRSQIEPAARLDVLLYSGERRASSACSPALRDLLPGRYRFGITGRGPGGAVLAPGSYEIRLVAWPTLGGSRAGPRSASGSSDLSAE